MINDIDTAKSYATKPVLELRNVKHSRSLSEETPAYTAALYVDGKLFCTIRNHGHGGCDDYDPPRGVTGAALDAAIRELDERVKATFPKIDVSEMYRKPAGSEWMEQSLEGVCHQLLADAEFAAMLRRDISKKVLFQKPGSASIWEVRIPPQAKAQAGGVSLVIATVKKTHGIERTLNEMPFAEALTLYSTAS